MKINLPKGLKRAGFFNGPSFKDGEEILFNYCSTCVKHEHCKKNEILRYAMGENFPYWHKDFIPIEVPIGSEYFQQTETHVMCNTYEDKQLKLKGMKNFTWADSVRRLIDITKTLQAEEA